MRILVTGGAGFIGSNYIHHLFHTYGAAGPSGCCPDADAYAPPGGDAEVVVLNVDKLTYAADPRHLAGIAERPGYAFAKADICDAGAFDQAVAGFEPDAIVHFAAESHVDRSIEAGDVFVRTNVLGTQNVLDSARRHDVDLVVHVSTDEVYGSVEKGSSRESDPYNPSSPYSASKAGSDLLALAHHHTYGLPVIVTRCTNNYGPRQHTEKLLPKMITLALDTRPLTLYGSGLNVRDWLYVKDHCAAIETIRTRGTGGQVYNIAGRDERPNVEIVRAVLGRLGKPESLITHVKDRPGHDWRYSLDDAKTRALGWAPRVRFDAGLDHTIAWVRQRSAGAGSP